MLRWIHIGLLCIQNNTDDRPTILDVLFMLRNDSTPLSLPKNQPFFFLDEMALGQLFPGPNKDSSRSF